MAAKRAAAGRTFEPVPEAISKITIGGFKSLSRESSLEIRPLTILAGANSSGKSSAIQPLLLLKQTLDATYDPGTLLLSGPNVNFSSRDQLLARGCAEFSLGLETDNKKASASLFCKDPTGGFVNARMSYQLGNASIVLTPGMDGRKLEEVIRAFMADLEALEAVAEKIGRWRLLDSVVVQDEWKVVPRRCFLSAQSSKSLAMSQIIDTSTFESVLQRMIHVPALRGNPARSYPKSAVGSSFPGAFDNYVASIVYDWQSRGLESLETLERSLDRLQLGWKIDASPVNDVKVELRVSRPPKKTTRGAPDMVSIADVGFGLSQTLPVIVALIAAGTGQLVYLEQPEIHLHPRAQTRLAEILVKAANRGVRIIAETHSENLLLGIQTCVAEGKIDPGDVKLHWFTRGKDGVTRISSADLDEAGAFGDWPEDFADVALSAQRRYLDASEKKLRISSK